MSTTTTPTEVPDRFAVAAAVLADAHALAWTRQLDLAAVRDRAKELRERLSGGDDTVTATALAKADAEVERAALLHSAAVTTFRRAERTQPHRPNLATAISADLAGILGVPVVVIEEGAFPTTPPDTIPTLYLRQPKPSTANVYAGTASGIVDLAYVRTPLHAALDGDKIADALWAFGHTVKVRPELTESLGDDLEIETHRITCAHVWDALPVIATTPQPGEKSSALTSVAKRIADDMAWDTRIDRIRQDGGEPLIHAHAAATIKAVIVSNSRRTITAHLTLGLSQAWPGSYPATDMKALVERTLPSLIGRPFSYLGRTASIDVIDTRPGHRGGFTYSIAMTFASAVPATA
jgi:hypothetical protein